MRMTAPAHCGVPCRLPCSFDAHECLAANFASLPLHLGNTHAGYLLAMRILCELSGDIVSASEEVVQRSKVLKGTVQELAVSSGSSVPLACTLQQWRTWARNEVTEHIDDVEHIFAVVRVRSALMCSCILTRWCYLSRYPYPGS